MKQITLNVPDHKYTFFLQLIHELDFVEIADNQDQQFTDDYNYYNPDFVEKINISRQEIENGNFVRVEKENLRAFLGLS